MKKIDVLDITIGDIKGFFKNMAFTNQSNAGNDMDGAIKLFCKPEEGGFDWYETVEGFEFWHSVSKQKYLEALNNYQGEDKLLIIEVYNEGKIYLHTKEGVEFRLATEIETLKRLDEYKKTGYRIWTHNVGKNKS